MKGTAAYICGGNKKPNQHYYPARLVVADAALLAAKSKGLALSLTLSLRLFREKSRFATNFSRYTSLPPRLDLPSARGALYRPAGLVREKRRAPSKEGRYKRLHFAAFPHLSPHKKAKGQNLFPFRFSFSFATFLFSFLVKRKRKVVS